MEKLRFDSGVKTYALGELGVLRFNPADPNVYGRFLEASERIAAVEKTLRQQAQALTDDGEGAVRLLQQADRQMKGLLTEIFGSQNDFEEILQGVNLLAVAENGERVITNLLAALEPVLVSGAKRCAGQEVKKARAQAAARRKTQC